LVKLASEAQDSEKPQSWNHRNHIQLLDTWSDAQTEIREFFGTRVLLGLLSDDQAQILGGFQNRAGDKEGNEQYFSEFSHDYSGIVLKGREIWYICKYIYLE
jgi:hypothetical protein